MRKKLFTLLGLVLFISCNKTYTTDTKGFQEIEKELKGKFGNDAFYTNLSIIPIQQLGTTITTTVTKEPSSLKMGEWTYSQNTWKQTSEITLEVTGNAKAEDFMFNLNDKISLSKLGELVEKSMKKLKEEKKIENPVLDIASIVFPDNGDISKAEYSINLKPKNGGTTFRFNYLLDGTLLKMDY